MPPDPTPVPGHRIPFKKALEPELSDADKFAWSWMQEIFDLEFPKLCLRERILLLLSSLIIIKQSRAEIEEKAHILYGYLPGRMRQLRWARINARGYLKKALKGNWCTRLLLIGYIPALKALILAIGVKLANSLTRPNRWGWKDERAYRLFVALQTNLARIRPIYFVTLTFEGNIHYDDVRQSVKDFRENIRDHMGYYSTGVIAFGTHTPYQAWRFNRFQANTAHQEPRLHCHLLVWPVRERCDKGEAEAFQNLERIFTERRHGLGREYDLMPLPTTEDFLRVCSYIALNYSGSILIDRKVDTCPIPPGSNPIIRTENVLPGVPWKTVGDMSLVTPYTIAWRDAVGRYAEERGYDSSDSMGWIHFETENIKEIMEPEQWRDASVTGLDGYNYRVKPYEPSADGTDQYLLFNPERPIYTISERDLSSLGSLDAFPGALPQNQDYHPVTGEGQATIPQLETKRAKRTSSLLVNAIIGAIGIALIGIAVWQLFKRKL